MDALRRGALVAVAFVVAAGCVAHPVGPARTHDAYVGKAVTTAESALSVVETVRLVTDAAGRGRAFGPYVSIVVSDAEESLSGLSGTIASVQPPDERADALHAELAELLSRASAHTRDVRVAARRNQLRDLDDVAAPLADDAAALTRFVEEHG